MDAAALETHMSVLFFYGDRVVKVRKPVSYGFADFREADARREDCLREVELNRRLSPDVYVGTATVLVGGRAAEHAVVMRRLPADRNLASMVQRGEHVDQELWRIAETLARFHRTARRSPMIDTSATADALWQRWQATEEALGRFIGPVVDHDDYRRLTTLAQRFLTGWHTLFDRRIGDGAICDGHGDLQGADVFCLGDGPRILDCLEFDDRLRHADVVADAAFLAQDLERIGAPREARVFADAYRTASASDHPESLLHFYVAVRAHVRLLVECLRLEQGLGALAAEPSAVLAQAISHMEAAIPRLVLVGGLPGTGKSTLASFVARELGAALFSTDELRARGTTDDLGPVPFATGAYTPEKRLGVYEDLVAKAADPLTGGRSVVLDATWSDAAFRDLASTTARRTGAALVELECRCAPEVRASRIAGRPHRGRGDSHATVDVADALAGVADPWPTARVLDTSGAFDDSVKWALEALAASLSTSGC